MQFYLQWMLRFVRLTVGSSMLLVFMSHFYSWDQRAFGAEEGRAVITVDNRSGNPSGADHTDIGEALRLSGADTTIRVEEGEYVIDNPIIVKHKGVTISGRGREKTVIRPKNAGKAIVKFDADYSRLENLTINAESVDGRGRGTFGVHIKKGRAYSEVVNTKILNTGASAIIGLSVADSRLDGNIILNAGDDGIHLRGERLTISHNILFRYFDEAIDVGGGDDISVIHNYALHGRIGITVGGGRNTFVYGNTVEDHVFGGFHIGSKEGGVVSHNVVKDSRGPAYQLESLQVVDANIVEGENTVGFIISDMRDGVIQRNQVFGADAGLRLFRSRGNVIFANSYSGDNEVAIALDEASEGNHWHNSQVSIARDRATEAGVFFQQRGATKRTWTAVKSVLGDDPDFMRIAGAQRWEGIEVNGESERDKESAKALANFLARHNPGFLSIHVRGNEIASEVTPDLYSTLRGSGQLGIGLVRAPVRMLARVSGVSFPVWHLFVGSDEVAVVTVRPSGPGAHVLFTEKGESSLTRVLKLSASEVVYALSTVFGLELESIYYHRRKWAAVIILFPAAILALGVMWGTKRWRLFRNGT